MIEVSQLYTYPVKSARGIALHTLPFDRFGPEADRRWMVVDNHGRFITQRQKPAMCLLKTRLVDEGLILGIPGVGEVLVDRNSMAQQRVTQVKVWHDQVEAIDCGDKIAGLLSDYLEQRCRLVYMADDCHRPIDSNFTPNIASNYVSADQRVSFADGFPALLISEASLASLNERLSKPVDMWRFRPNIVVRGTLPFAEDDWLGLRLSIGGLEFSVVKPCSRCVIPSIDPLTAEKDKSVLTALAEYRRRDGAIYFGQNVICPEAGQISVGDAVELIG